MSADAVALFHPRDVDRLKPFLDLDGETEESDGLYAEALEDGSFLVHTFQPFEIFQNDPDEAQLWLSQFGDALVDVHDDPRGLLFFPDTHEPVATSYDAVVAELADVGVFVPVPGGSPAIDLEALQSLAGELLGGKDPREASPFELGRLVENFQREIATVLAVPEEKSPIVDDEFDEPPPDKQRRG
jgi:hypothetical protein